MAERRGEELLFGRYTREECGFVSPIGYGGPVRRALPVAAMLVLLLAAGWIAGTFAARWREAWLAELPFRSTLATPGDASDLLALGRMYALALPARPAAAANLALALSWTAERAPRPAGYLGNAANLFAGIDDWRRLETGIAFPAALSAAWVFQEAGDYAKAFASLDRAAEALDAVRDEPRRLGGRALLLNSRAYLLAVAPAAAGGRDAQRSLALIRTALTARDELPGGGFPSGSAAILDTLAAAWLALGEGDRAGQAQFLALGLAESDGLDSYIRRYDEIAAGAENRSAGK